jgi:hypothetical protein
LNCDIDEIAERHGINRNHLVKKSSHTTHLRDISSSARIMRERRPFEGRSLPLMGRMKRGGALLLLVVLPRMTL